MLMMLLLVPFQLAAQKRGVVRDLETNVPLRDVIIYGKHGLKVTTDWAGRFELPIDSGSVTFSHRKYMSRPVNVEEIDSTVYLLPSGEMLNEVVVWGKRGNKDHLAAYNAKEMQMQQALPANFDLLALVALGIDLLFPKSHKATEAERRQQILDNY